MRVQYQMELLAVDQAPLLRGDPYKPAVFALKPGTNNDVLAKHHQHSTSTPLHLECAKRQVRDHLLVCKFVAIRALDDSCTGAGEGRLGARNG